MSDAVDHHPLYVAARSVLLDALTSLAPHGKAVIVVGAQAVYLRTGGGELDGAIAPYTTDGDLALDPTLLGDVPELEESMQQAGFTLAAPGVWHSLRNVAGRDVVIPVDLIVPEAASTGEGGRGARLGVHGHRAARRAVGLEASLIDHSPMAVPALNPTDGRTIMVEVAGPPALLVAKAHKIHDRLAGGRPDRLIDKDAADVYRIMQTTRGPEVATTLRELCAVPGSATETENALDYLRELFGRRAGHGVAMAQRALRLAIDEAQVATLCVAFIEQILVARDP